MVRVLLVGIVGAFALQPAAAAPKGSKPDMVRHLFVLPNADRLEGERGRLRVPETNKRGARQIEIAFARIPGRTKHAGPPIFWIDGGPGSSAIAAFNEKPAMIAMLREFGDVIAVDQRGAGESPEVLDCPQRWALPLDRPVARTDVVSETRRIFGECRAQWSAHGVDLDGYNSAAYADDIIHVADALGYSKVRLYAFSYGTQIALATMARHPSRVERATLFGVMGLGASLRDPAALDGALDRASALLAGAGGNNPSLRDLAEQAIKAVSSRPVWLPSAEGAGGASSSVLLDAAALKSFIVNAINSRSALPDLPRFLSAVAADVGLATLGLADPIVRRLIDDMNWTRRGPAHRRAALQHYATVCASGISTEGRKALLEKRESSLLGQTQHVGLPEACDALNVADVGTALRAARIERIPLLLISGSIDTKTPLEQAQVVAAAHPGAILITVAGAGHGDLLGNRDVEPVVRAFLAGQSPASQTISLPPIALTPSR